MLEYDFNELDNDFATLWSQFIIAGPNPQLTKKIEALAELGQINAIQSWYLIKSQSSKNPRIDALVDELEENSRGSYTHIGANDFLAIAHRYCSKNQVGNYKRYRDMAVQLFKQRVDLNHGAITGQRFLELYTSALQDNEYLDFSDRRMIKQVRKCLIERLKDGEDTPQLRYALGKNIVLFQDLVLTTNKTRDYGINILIDLSKRELSETLKSKISELGKRTIAKEINETIEKIDKEETAEYAEYLDSGVLGVLRFANSHPYQVKTDGEDSKYSQPDMEEAQNTKMSKSDKSESDIEERTL